MTSYLTIQSSRPLSAAQDVLTQVLAAAQPNLITAAALRVLQQPHLHTEPATPPEASSTPKAKQRGQQGHTVQHQEQPQRSSAGSSHPAASASRHPGMPAVSGQERDGDGGLQEASLGSGYTSSEASSDGRHPGSGSDAAAEKGGPWLWLRCELFKIVGPETVSHSMLALLSELISIWPS